MSYQRSKRLFPTVHLHDPDSGDELRGQLNPPSRLLGNAAPEVYSQPQSIQMKVRYALREAVHRNRKYKCILEDSGGVYESVVSGGYTRSVSVKVYGRAVSGPVYARAASVPAYLRAGLCMRTVGGSVY